MAACGSPMLQFNQAPLENSGDCEDCVQVVKTTKKVRVPCHRNTYKQYTVKIPRQINEKVARTVNYTDYESRTKQVPYTINRTEQRVRMDTQTYQVPVQKHTTKMVSVTRKVPKTIYVDMTTQVPKQETTTVMENRTRQVKIPYSVNVPETRYRTENYQIPVQRQKTVYDNVSKTVYDTQVRTRCEPKVTYVTKEIPVFNVVARPAQPCPQGGQTDPIGSVGVAPVDSQSGGYVPHGVQQEFNQLDTNNDGMMSMQEYAAARGHASQAMAPHGGSVMTPYGHH